MSLTTIVDDLQHVNPAICTLFFLPLFYWSKLFSWHQSVKVHALLVDERVLYIYQRLVIMYLMGLIKILLKQLQFATYSPSSSPTHLHLGIRLLYQSTVTTLLCTLLRCRVLLACCIYCSLPFFSTKSSWLSKLKISISPNSQIYLLLVNMPVSQLIRHHSTTSFSLEIFFRILFCKDLWWKPPNIDLVNEWI